MLTSAWDTKSSAKTAIANSHLGGSISERVGSTEPGDRLPGRHCIAGRCLQSDGDDLPGRE